MSTILSFGAYIPRYRLSRKAVIAANSWFSGKMGALAKGERCIGNWDEDPVTMAVAAGRNALAGHPMPSEVWLASTTAPFADRQNSGIVIGALGCSDDTAALDLGGSMRAATSGLLTAFRAAGGDRTILMTTAEQRQSKAGSTAELTTGDAGVAFLIGDGEGIADLVAAKQMTVDFVDHYRAAQNKYDYNWEERWLRDEGFAKLVPALVKDVLAEANLKPEDIDHFILPALSGVIPGMIARKTGIAETAISDGLFSNVGNSGCSHGCLMLAKILENAEPGETILLIGFGQGVDAIILKTQPAIADFKPHDSMDAQLSRGFISDNYMRYLSINNRVEQERGLRAELDLQTAPTIMYRNRKMLLGFNGGKCTKCGAAQFPKHPICVNPNCGAQDTQEDYSFSDTPATLQSFTIDNLTYTPDPPAIYGMVNFMEGGALMMDFTDTMPDEMEAGMALSMVFRIKSEDTRRGMKRYFWKASPKLN